jgi:arylsulfatase A-like enzyme
MEHRKQKTAYWWRKALFLTGASAVMMSPVLTMEPAIAEAAPAEGDGAKPNILVIWGDDIGTWYISHNNRGMMGYQTPNIDRIADEGVSFTDYYAQQSSTAGRAAFISGSVPVRSGMTKVGLPGAAEGWQKTDVTMATVLKGQGYATGQFGKNHQGDRNEHLPTIHGFDEFLGNLYHLNAEEEPENEDYPRDMMLANGKTFLETFGPRGVMHCYATDKDDPTEIPRFGKWGKQKSAWKPSMMKPGLRPRISSRARSKRVSRFSPGGTARACTSAPMSGTNIATPETTNTLTG